LKTFDVVWVTRWIRIVGKHYGRPRYRCKLVEIRSLTYFMSVRFFLRGSHVCLFYFKSVKGKFFLLFISSRVKKDENRGKRCHTGTMISTDTGEDQKWTPIMFHLGKGYIQNDM
jgi:hypothetical protein